MTGARSSSGGAQQVSGGGGGRDVTAVLRAGGDALLIAAARRFADKMGNADSKLHFRKAVIQLTTKTQVGCFLLYTLSYTFYFIII